MPSSRRHFSTLRDERDVLLAILLKHSLQCHCSDFRKALIIHASMTSSLAQGRLFHSACQTNTSQSPSCTPEEYSGAPQFLTMTVSISGNSLSHSSAQRGAQTGATQKILHTWHRGQQLGQCPHPILAGTLAHLSTAQSIGQHSHGGPMQGPQSNSYGTDRYWPNVSFMRRRASNVT